MKHRKIRSSKVDDYHRCLWPLLLENRSMAVGIGKETQRLAKEIERRIATCTGLQTID
ncbi:MAG: hypothetical protein NTY15_20405 [Planctomycetota bacterium]|nr:hypothetical protein [Planctomycetota bacterium]